MNTRLLGALCMVGGVVWLGDGVRMAILGLKLPDMIGVAANLVLALCGLCGVLGLISVKATGTNPILRMLSYLPALGFVLLGIGSILRLTGIVSNPQDNWVIGLGFALILSGFVVVGILAIAARTWTGWRKLTPLLPLLALLGGAMLEGITGLSGMPNVLAGAAFVLLGYAIQTAESALQLRKAMA